MVLGTPSRCLRGKTRSLSNNRNFPRSQAEGLVGLEAPSRWNLLSRQLTKADHILKCRPRQPREVTLLNLLRGSVLRTRPGFIAQLLGRNDERRGINNGDGCAQIGCSRLHRGRNHSFPEGNSPVGRWISTIKLPCLSHLGVVWLSAREQNWI